MGSGHAFWWLMTIAVMVWYSTVTIYVAYKGAKDIKNMLKRVKEQCDVDPENCDNQ
ncbi:MAG: hypothetical protein ACYC27_09595 [Armatimonadota bacterium]